MRKLSASSLKDLLKDYPRFEQRFTTWITIKTFNPAFVVWNCLHSVAEHYAITGELDIEKAYEQLENKKWEFTIIIDNDIVHTRTDEQIEECKEWIANWFENMKWVLRRWEAEIQIDDDDFTWFIDNLENEEITDWKFVNKFNSKWLFDSIPWYLIQWSLYANSYFKKQGNLPKVIRFVEILKTQPYITKWYWVTKEVIINAIEEQQWIDLTSARTDRKYTIDMLLEEHKPRQNATQIISFIPDEEFCKFWQDILDLWIKIRDMIYEFGLQKEKDVQWTSEVISYYIKKFQDLVNDRVKKYYDDLDSNIKNG